MSAGEHTPAGFRHVSGNAIARWRVLLAACVGLLALAAIAWLKIPRLEDPRVDTSEIVAVLPYPGASASDVESQVLKVVEPELYDLDGIEWIDSQALPGAARVRLKFEEGAPLDVLVERVRGRIAGKRTDLPSELEEPEIRRASTAGTPVMVVAVAGYRSDVVLSDAARRVRDALVVVSGVAGATLRGDVDRAVRVKIDPARLAQHGLDVREVARQLRLANARAPGGELRVAELGTLLEIGEEIGMAAAARALPLRAATDADGATRVLTLGDVAEVTDGERTPTERFIYDGAPAVGIELRFRSDANAIATGDRVRARLATLEPTLHKLVQLRVAHDQPQWIAESIRSLLENLGEGIVLVVAIITLGLGLRAALVVAGVLPLAMAGALVGLFVGGFALEQISIAGLIVALGLLVDDAVVVAESINVMHERGLDRLRAAILGTARVFWANNATTAVACASFLPLFFMGGTIGLFVRSLPASIVLALVTSLVVAQLFTPWASLFMRTRSPRHPARPPGDPRDDLAASPDDEHNLGLRALKRVYAACARVVLRHPAKVVLGFTALLVASIAALPRIGVQFFPKSDKPALFVKVDVARGAHLDATTEKLEAVSAAIQEDPAVLDVSAVAGGGYPRVFPGRVAPGAATDVADAYVRVQRGASVAQLASRLRVRLGRIAGVRASVEELYSGPPVPHPIVLRISGDSYDGLKRYAADVERELAAIPGAINVQDTMRDATPVTRVVLDRERALRVGLTPADVAAALRALHGEDKVAELREGTDRVDVVLVDGSHGAPLAGIEATPLATLDGRSVPLGAIATVRLTYGPAELRHRDTRRDVEITADVDGSTLPAKVLAVLDARLATRTWQNGYVLSHGGAREETEKSFRYLGLASIAALVLIAILLLLVFDSLALAGAILFAVPFALIGAVAGLGAAGLPFGFMSFLGLTALVGVYVNHKIYFVDRLRELMSRGYTLDRAVLQAGNDRIRPVVLTALTAVLGLVPLTIAGGPMWASFGWVNIFGLVASIPLSLVFLPAVVVVAVRTRDAIRVVPRTDDLPHDGNLIDSIPARIAGAAPMLASGGRGRISTSDSKEN